MRITTIGRLLAGILLLWAFAASASAQSFVEIRSGLPWASGVTRPGAAFGAWRGSPIDLRTVFFGKLNWNHIRASAKTRPDTPRMAIGFPMLPVTHRGQLAACASGAFDGNMREIRDAMLANGWKGSLVRLGWEFNRVDHSVFPWAAQGDGSSYVGCFRRWVGILNAGAKNFVIVWNAGNEGTYPGPIERLWPGDSYVDIVGSNFYDRCPPMRTDAEFEERVNRRDKWGNPAGPQAWLAWAKARGKKWALPEWGVGGQTTGCNKPGFDNPFFMRKLNEFLRANAGQVAFESYFNGRVNATGSHEIYPAIYNPKAAAMYQQLW